MRYLKDDLAEVVGSVPAEVGDAVALSAEGAAIRPLPLRPALLRRHEPAAEGPTWE